MVEEEETKDAARCLPIGWRLDASLKFAVVPSNLADVINITSDIMSYERKMKKLNLDILANPSTCAGAMQRM